MKIWTTKRNQSIIKKDSEMIKTHLRITEFIFVYVKKAIQWVGWNWKCGQVTKQILEG